MVWVAFGAGIAIGFFACAFIIGVGQMQRRKV